MVPGRSTGGNMITGLDHVVALVRDIGTARAAYQTLLGRAPAWQNSGEGADRVLFTLANMTIELMAPNGVSVAADRMRGPRPQAPGARGPGTGARQAVLSCRGHEKNAPAAGGGGAQAGSGRRGRK